VHEAIEAALPILKDANIPVITTGGTKGLTDQPPLADLSSRPRN
jgi:hypothetical protein